MTKRAFRHAAVMTTIRASRAKTPQKLAGAAVLTVGFAMVGCSGESVGGGYSSSTNGLRSSSSFPRRPPTR